MLRDAFRSYGAGVVMEIAVFLVCPRIYINSKYLRFVLDCVRQALLERKLIKSLRPLVRGGPVGGALRRSHWYSIIVYIVYIIYL